MDPFVCVNLFGGLGNQIFQYAAAKAVAKINNCRILVNKESDNAHNINNHNYAQELFKDTIEVDWPRGPLGEWLFKSQGVNVFSQGDGFEAWDPHTVQIPCVLNGYFQYYPALIDCLPSVCAEIRKNGPFYPNEDAVFLHIRRGDYLAKSDFHYLQGSDYYLNAVEILKPSKIRIFSDDIAWCKEQPWLQTLPNREFMEEKDEIKSFFQMIACKQGAILANSTFSWWAAMISETPNVVYPSRWINQTITDLFPSTWIKV
jgi:hypothetical protein